LSPLVAKEKKMKKKLAFFPSLLIAAATERRAVDYFIGM
jgi:hypothetical protein